MSETEIKELANWAAEKVRQEEQKEKLIELLKKTEISRIYGKRALAEVCFTPNVFESMADNLIANGVTLESHDCHWATEQAYKNGYQKGRQDAVKWVPVADKLPKKAGWYLAYGDSKYINMRFTRTLCWNGRWWSDVTGAGFRVTHWMPLPELPKGE